MVRYKLIALDEEGRNVPRLTRRNSSKFIIDRYKENLKKVHPDFEFRIIEQ